eukprot:TRINITY_DN9893_c0_g1_i1.p1 TRINITY_DN9893_c0_g1~~TRINITY_DN9893_c0_g1_i1.p1  ORF type:complete len:268 (+),score=37.89 TRINITY_DN9893_c0_g1_i1:48-851(+)
MDVCSSTFRQFLQLRSCVQEMKRGGPLFVEEETGIHMYWFVVSDDLLSLYWSDPQTMQATGSLDLRKVREIIGGHDQRSISRKGPSAAWIMRTDDSEIYVIAPNWNAFSVWYKGLICLTGLPNEPQSHISDQYSSKTHGVRGSQLGCDTKYRQKTWKYLSVENEPNRYLSRSSTSTNTNISKESYRNELLGRFERLKLQIINQEHHIQRLGDQNMALEDLRRQKDQVIQRLLKDLQEATPGHHRVKTPGYYSSKESDFNYRARKSSR